MRIAASQVAQWTAGRVVNAAAGVDPVAEGMWFDSRTLPAAYAFVALVGERDGHEFVESAVRAGAPFVVVETGRAVDGVVCVEVADTLSALADMAAVVRSMLEERDVPVVGITGSAGKTTTKELVRAVIGRGFRTPSAAVGSFNNDIGVPLTIINAPADCDALVLEMGMRGAGEIARLCRCARPSVGVVTLIADAHSERVGGVEGVARAKAEILESLEVGGIAVLNRDDEWFEVLAGRVPASVRTVTFGSRDAADVRWSIESIDDAGCPVTRFMVGESVHTGRVPLPGVHMASNAAAAVAVGVALGMDLRSCVAGVADVVGVSGRSQWKTTSEGVRVLDDSYNANSASVRAALETVSTVPGRKRVAVLGRMAEIDDAVHAHTRIASLASDLGIRLLALETDLYDGRAMSLAEVVDELAGLGAGDVVVVKGSLVSGATRVIEALGL